MKGKTAKLIRQARAAINAEDGKHYEHVEADDRRVVTDLMETNSGAFAELKTRASAMPKNTNLQNAISDLIARINRKLKRKQDPAYRLKLRQALAILSA